jgi:hypothetical protein
MSEDEQAEKDRLSAQFGFKSNWLWYRSASWPQEMKWQRLGDRRKVQGRPWTLSIAGLRAEGPQRFLRGHATGMEEPRSDSIPSGGMLLGGWGERAPTTAPPPAAVEARAVLSGSNWLMSIYADNELLGQTESKNSREHSYGNIFGKYELVNGTMDLVEGGIELTAFAVPVPGKQHARVVLKTWRIDDPTRPKLITIVLSRH